MSLLHLVHQQLETAGIPHALIGAAALAVHGVSRSTFDQDLLITDRRGLTAETWAALGDRAQVEIRRGDDDDPLAGVVRITSRGERDVDVVVGRYEWQRSIIDDATTLNTPSGPLRVASPEGLILLKLFAGGPQDLWDIEQLRASVGHEVDARVEDKIGHLPPAARSIWDMRRR